jgi:hypothetical protein
MISGIDLGHSGTDLSILALSVLGHMATIALRPFSGNFTRTETRAVKNSEVLSYFFHLHCINN